MLTNSSNPAAKKSIYIKTFGCQMNVYDSTRMEGILGEKGFSYSQDIRTADVILINTCSIRDKSEHKVLSLLGQLKDIKTPGKVLGVTGCIGQRMGRTLLQRVPHLDIVMGPDGVNRVGEIVSEVLNKGVRIVDAKLDTGEGRRYSQPGKIQRAKPSEFITIMKGCDHFCTYCIVPFVRGREKSRSVDEIIGEVRQYVENGTKEITFLGQNINTYGKGTGETLAQLIDRANEIEGLERIRYVTSHPRDLGQDLIDQFGSVKKLCPALHLPFQSGSNPVLKRMSRLYTAEDYLAKVDALRKACPDLALSTDIIVGFPGETDEDFQGTLKVLRDVGFSQVFAFTYSPRPGTKAHAYEDDIPLAVKEARLQTVLSISMKHLEAENGSLIGKVIPVLIEEKDKKGMYLSGRTPHNKLVHVWNAGDACMSKIIDVEIHETTANSLRGYYVGAPKQHRKFASKSEKALSAPVSIA